MTFPHNETAQAIEAVRKPLTQASTLPPGCYTTEEWYEREIEAIWLREWVCVGRADQIPKPGDFFTIDVVGEPLLINRTERGEIRAHINSCRHRGSAIAKGCGNVKLFRCPYHSWLYRLDGSLSGTPGRDKPMSDVENFKHEDHGLIDVKAGTWGGFIYVNLDPNALPFSTWLGDMPEFFKNYKLDEMLCTRSVSMEVKSNWKLQVDNFLEGYHIHTVHAKHMSHDYPQEWTSMAESRGPYTGHYLKNSLSRIGQLPIIEGLTEHQKNGVFHVWMAPNVKLSVTNTYMKFFMILPDGPARHRLIAHWCFPRTTIELPQFEEVVGPNYYGRGTIGKINGEWVDEIIIEDNDVLEQMQIGLSSRYAPSGRYATTEAQVHIFANYILDRMNSAGPITPPQMTSAWRNPDRA